MYAAASGERFPERIRFLVSIQIAGSTSATMPGAVNVVVQGQTDADNGAARRIIQPRTLQRPAPIPGSGLMTDFNSLGFIITALFLYSTVYTHPGAPDFLIGFIWVTLATLAILKAYAICHRLFHLGVPLEDDLPNGRPPARTGGRYDRFFLQVVLNRGEDDAGEEAPAFNRHGPSGLGMIELNALPVRNYRLPAVAESGSSSSNEASSSTAIGENSQKPARRYGDDDLTCSICLEDVRTGEPVRHLPCLHQFHQRCIDIWLRQRGVCPICKASVWRGLLERASVGNNGMGRADA